MNVFVDEDDSDGILLQILCYMQVSADISTLKIVLS